MSYCYECGSKADGQVFCNMCGTRLLQSSDSPVNTSTPSYVESRSSPYPTEPYSRTPKFEERTPLEKTTHLQIVIVLQWIGVVLLGIATLVTLIVFFPVGLLVGLFFAIQLWIVRGLSDLKNSARIVLVVLTGIGLFSSVVGMLTGNGFDFIGFVISIFVFYTLAFHRPTIDLFTVNQPFSRSGPIPSSY